MKRFALICGASGSIGEAIARQLAADGWSLYLHCGQSINKTEALYAELSESYVNQEFNIIQADFTQIDAAEKITTQIFSLQAIVFANGHAQYGLLEDHTAEDIRALWLVHVETPMRICQQLATKLRQHSASYVTFISSIWGLTGASGEVVYSTVKGAQNSFIKAYSREVALNGIRVNAIAPGIVDTIMNSHLDDEEMQYIINEIPLAQLGKVEDIAHMTSFLLSGKADYITGQILQVNGGWYI